MGATMKTVVTTIEVEGMSVELRAYYSSADIGAGWHWIARSEDPTIPYRRQAKRSWHRADYAIESAERIVRRELEA